MNEDEELPKDNPAQICFRCVKKYPIWRMHLFHGELKPRLAHNFCPGLTPDGKTVNLCIKCKMEDVVSLWGKG